MISDSHNLIAACKSWGLVCESCRALGTKTGSKDHMTQRNARFVWERSGRVRECMLVFVECVQRKKCWTSRLVDQFTCNSLFFWQYVGQFFSWLIDTKTWEYLFLAFITFNAAIKFTGLRSTSDVRCVCVRSVVAILSLQKLSTMKSSHTLSWDTSCTRNIRNGTRRCSISRSLRS